YMTVALTLAIVCLHFIGMVAFNVSVLDISSEHVNPEAFQTLALAVAGTAVIIVICGFLSYVVENRANLESIAELSAARNAAENASRAKSEFMSVLSHELRTPLTIVLGYASMLSALREVQIKQSGGSGDGSEQTATSEQMIDQAEQFGEKIKVAANHLLTLINEILDYTSLEANDTKLAPTSFPVRDLLHQVVDQFEDLAVKKSTRIYFENDDIIAFADRGRCLQVLINLVGNALKFSGSTEIALRARMTETGFSFEVEDNGCGIPEEDLERIFEAFLQLESAGHRSEGGTGLGLAISKKLADAQGGNITVQSILGTGTKFTFNLPMDAVGSTIAPSQNAELAGGKSAPSLESIKIG
ncbi:MAG: ATP-binding protein, partial [Yoonia sp.]|uniref:sensor histidine kinase n=1 Tax=Yoonia sp. TaxID=2212373 RepID=UPI003EF4D8BA